MHEVAWRTPKPVVMGGLRRGTLTRIGNEQVRQRIQTLWESGSLKESEPLPEVARELEIEELISLLMDSGLPVSQAETISSTTWRLRRLARWYQRRGAEVGEHEIRSFLIAPLLLALGWPEQRIKIEWKHLDIALFDQQYAAGATPSIIVESSAFTTRWAWAPRTKRWATRLGTTPAKPSSSPTAFVTS